jgi:hypothetical protein
MTPNQPSEMRNMTPEEQRAYSESLSRLFKKTKEPSAEERCPYCGPDGIVREGGGEHSCQHCGGAAQMPEPSAEALAIAANCGNPHEYSGDVFDLALAIDNLIASRVATSEETIRKLRAELAWAIKNIEDNSDLRDDGTPDHYCDYTHHPNTGDCEFHRMFWKAKESLGQLPEDREATDD